MSETSHFPTLTRLRRPPACQPVRLRATITLDIEAEDYLAAERLKAKVAAEYDLLRTIHPEATLEFRHRKPRSGPRAAAPSMIMAYVDD